MYTLGRREVKVSDIWMWPQEETQERCRKTKCIMPTAPRQCHHMPQGSHTESPRERAQKARGEPRGSEDPRPVPLLGVKKGMREFHWCV